VVRTVGAGVAAGFVWGVVARGFMRLLATTPEFTWSGTLGIIGVASTVGGLVALVRHARRSGWSSWWRLLGVPFVLLFGAAGSLMLPGVAGVVLVLARRRWTAVPGLALVGLTVWAVVVQDLGGSLTVRQWAGVAIMLACLAVEGWAARELVRRWRPPVARPLTASGAPGERVAAGTSTEGGDAQRTRTLAP
jgi:protein-S-isoprenylcysteine O-methyltransferase Ste14